MEAADRITTLITPTVESLGFELVRVNYGGGRKPTLQIMAERPDGTMGVGDCATLSRELSVLLDVEDPLPTEYLLEVSSPGIDRPLTREKDFGRWAGFDAKVELGEDREGRRRYRGTLLGVENGLIGLDTGAGEVGVVHFAIAEVSKAKLLLTDKLLKAAAKGFKPSGNAGQE